MFTEELLKKAEAGDASAQFNLGVCYKNGRGTTRDYNKAFQWYQKAAEAGYEYGQYKFGPLLSQWQGNS